MDMCNKTHLFLSIFFASIYIYSIIPNDRKTTGVTLRYKNGLRNLSANYRPISVLPAMSETRERILHKQFYKYLTENDLSENHNLVPVK